MVEVVELPEEGQESNFNVFRVMKAGFSSIRV